MFGATAPLYFPDPERCPDHRRSDFESFYSKEKFILLHRRKSSKMTGRGFEMTTTYLTLNEIRTIGFEALLRELGPAGTIRFIQQYETGRGDYTRDRRKWLPKKSVQEIGKQIVKGRQNS